MLNKTLTAPVITGATITTSTYNGLSITATTGTLTIAAAKTVTINNTLTFGGTDGSVVNFGAGGTVSYGSGTTTLTGDVTGSGSGTVATTIASIGGAAVTGSTGTGGHVVLSNAPAFTGIVTMGTALGVLYGGTGGTTAASAQSNLGVPSTTGTGASGTWGINISGNAATATSATTAGSASTATSATTATTATTANALNTGNGYQVAALGVNTASSTAGTILATGDITAFFSDMRLKTRLGPITNATKKIMSLDTFYYEPNELARSFGYRKQRRLGVSAQQIKKVAPEIVTDAPINGSPKLKKQQKAQDAVYGAAQRPAPCPAHCYRAGASSARSGSTEEGAQMTLPSSGALSLGNIKTEFGGNTSPKMSDYYAGGSFVPSGTVSPVSGSVPTSGTIHISNFYGTTKFTGRVDTFNAGNPGTGSVTVPFGARTVTITIEGGGGGGGAGIQSSSAGGGGGGASGGTNGVTRAIAPADWGASVSYTLGAAGTVGAGVAGGTGGTTLTSGSVAAGSLAISATGGAGGGKAQAGVGVGSGGSPPGTNFGTFSDNGHNGAPGTSGPGGTPGPSPNGDAFGFGGAGGNAAGSQPGNLGTGGQAIFNWG